MSVDGLPVSLYGTMIGHLERDGSRAVLRWSTEAEQRWGLRSRVLSASLRVGDDDADLSESFFGALLPEGEHIARLAREVKVDRGDLVGLLTEVGADLAGALRISGAAPRADRDPEALSSAQVGGLLDSADGFLLGGGGSALPGFQRKLTLTRVDGEWIRGNGVLPSTHILKPVGLDSRTAVEAEAYALAVARAAGLTTMGSWVEQIGARWVLVIERYDRRRVGTEIERVHQEDAAQALGIPWGGNEKFQQNDPRASLGAVAGLLDRGETLFSVRNDDRLRLLRYTAFNVAVGNTDAHAKNFSLLHDDGGSTSLAPIYDIAPLALAYDATTRLSMWVNGVEQLPEVTRDDLVAEGVSWGLTDAAATAAVDETLAAMVEATRVLPAHDSIESHVPGYVRGQAQNLLDGKPARIASHLPLMLRERLGTPQPRDEVPR
ncbi:HipA domain-containing protein [Microbacterium sp.]|uniref:type II toxin-antitoxin system HipA family toxin n=1 Tax=Microbacterium sp. TaxID=51671 RepID=UPI0025CEFDE1|nr:HipA domain-containing protein [Microbacterium sp.]MBT9607958.1 HipA domain-containing protein [Microbacterium sp.]